MEFSNLDEALFKDLDNLMRTKENDMFFQHTLGEVNGDHSNPSFFEGNAPRVPCNSIEDMKKRYDDFLNGVVNMIEPDLIELPKYKDDANDNVVDDSDNLNTNDSYNKNENETKNQELREKESSMVAKAMTKRPTLRTQQRKRGVPWTEEEHKQFLMGLHEYGKGDWKSISRFYVHSKTPIQVASHAQKFFRRQKSKTPIERRRSSIHDIQWVNATYIRFPLRHQNPPKQQISPPLFDLIPNYTVSPPCPTIYPTVHQTYSVSEMPACGGPTSLPDRTAFQVPACGSPTSLPDKTAFQVADSMMMPVMDQL
ncbi:hypothetical protein LguiA_013067 [Lonicera macranthoides]